MKQGRLAKGAKEGAKRGRVHVLCDILVKRYEDGSKFLDQMGTIPRLLQLFNDSNDNVIVDSLGVDLVMRNASVGGRWRRCVLVGIPSTSVVASSIQSMFCV